MFIHHIGYLYLNTQFKPKSVKLHCVKVIRRAFLFMCLSRIHNQFICLTSDLKRFVYLNINLRLSIQLPTIVTILINYETTDAAVLFVSQNHWLKKVQQLICHCRSHGQVAIHRLEPIHEPTCSKIINNTIQNKRFKHSPFRELILFILPIYVLSLNSFQKILLTTKEIFAIPFHIRVELCILVGVIFTECVSYRWSLEFRARPSLALL